jgi:hypothetical protein
MTATVGPWLVVRERCRICSHVAIAVVPVQAADGNLECARCHGMTADIEAVLDSESNWIPT